MGDQNPNHKQPTKTYDPNMVLNQRFLIFPNRYVRKARTHETTAVIGSGVGIGIINNIPRTMKKTIPA